MASSGRIQQEPTHPHSEYLDPSLIRKGIENGSIIQVSALYWVEPVSLLPVLIFKSGIFERHVSEFYRGKKHETRVIIMYWRAFFAVGSKIGT